MKAANACPIAEAASLSRSNTATESGPPASDGSMTAGRRKSSSKGPKDSPRLAMARDVAILASIALQHGASVDVIRHALAGRDIGPLSAALGLIR